MKIEKQYTKELQAAWNDLSFHDYISPKWNRDYKVPIRVIIDECSGYEYFQHPLCVFVPNGYNDNVDEDEFYALTVENTPQVIHYPDKPQVSVIDLYKIKTFIEDNVDLLKEISDYGDIDKLSETKYYKRDIINESKYDVTMRNVPKIYTGLDHDIWIDGGSKKKHADRIKVRISKNEYISIDMNGIVRAGDERKLSSKQLRRYKKFIKANRVVLNKIFRGEIAAKDSKDYLTTFDSKENLIEPVINKIKFDLKVSIEEYWTFNTVLVSYVSSLEHKYSLCRNNNVDEPIFIDGSGNAILFDCIDYYTLDDDGRVFAYAMKDNELYRLYIKPEKMVKEA